MALQYTTAFVCFSSLLLALNAVGQAVPPAPKAKFAFRIAKEDVSVDELMAERAADFYEIEKKKYELIESLARERYLETFWERLAQRDKLSVAEARTKYLKNRIHISETEIQETSERFKAQPRLQELKDTDRRAQAASHLEAVKVRDVVNNVILKAQKSKDLVVLYPPPTEPTYDVQVDDTEPARYGPLAEDTKPIVCKFKDCVSIVEYAEYQCPFARRAQSVIQQILTEYKGQIRFVTRDFPLGFHSRSRPASIAAKCAAEQGKFWAMNDLLFENQRALSDELLLTYAKSVGVEVHRFQQCRANPIALNAVIDQNFQSGERLGVSSTPSYFVAGHRLAKVPTIEDMRKHIDQALALLKRP